ncbi:CpsD/CapB family tyrosine-protein kinase [Anaerobacillus sp. CMMVII]|nr:CpsD/CapB family tyrosine-protein kinase [Anaerobacillus sp. CMMVII]
MLKKLINFTKKTKKRNLVTYSNPESIITEEYRTIRTNIQLSIEEHKYKTVLVTSPTNGEGKSTTIANLGVTLAQQKTKVLLIDANLRNPRLHSIFKLDNTWGLSSILTSSDWLDEAIKKTKFGNLDIVTSGPIPEDPAELLSSKAYKRFLFTASQVYDVILIDSPPVLEVTDTRLIANQCDSVVLVLRHGKSKVEKAIEAKKVLGFAKATLIGAIINEK